MKCGSCKGNHSSIAEVKECYGVKRSEIPSHLVGRVTPKQVDYINALLEQTGRDGASLDKPAGEMNFQEASDAIVMLKEERKTKVDPLYTFKSEQIYSATYTVVFEDQGELLDGSNRITLRFYTPAQGKWAGVQLIQYLYGPDNTTMFRRCGNWTGEGYRIWNQYRQDGRIVKAVKFMVESDEDRKAEAGLTYALMSSNCYRCNKKLTVPASIHRGLGPDCAEILGVV